MTAQDITFNPRTELLPNIVDHYAKVKPDALYAEYPKSPLTYEHGYRQVTFRDLANAVNGVAAWLTEKLGPGNGEILPYVGANDVRYPALVLGAAKAGYVMFYTSPRNSVVAHESLFKELNCTKFLSPTPRPPPVTAILDAFKMDVLEVPSVDELLNTPYPHFEFSKTYPEAAGERLVVVHTSGSTGIPKPIFWTHDAGNKNMEMGILDAPEGFEAQDRWMMTKRIFSALPPFHAAGLAMLLFLVMPVGGTVICPTSAGLPSAAGLVEVMKHTPVEAALVAPFMVLELAQSPELLEYCSQHLELLAYAGGDLPQAIGDAVASRVRLINRYGASEMGLLNLVHSDTYRDRLKDWRYMHFHPALGAEFRHVTGDEYELVFVRSPEREPHQMMFTLFPELQEYHTRDLFIRHPDESKADLWRYSARADDVVVFLNGEKTNPVSMEQHITASNSEVTGVLVAGAQRFQASLMIEFGGKDLNPSERAAAIEKLWPSIEEANAVCPAHARVAKTHILFTTSEKPMLRAGKGTIQRAGTLDLYAQELESLYADADRLASHTDGELAGPGRVNDAQVVSDFIRQSLVSIAKWDNLSDEDNFFNLGLDSLQAITAARWLKRGLDFPSFTTNLIYLHPSVSELTQAVLQLQQHHEASEETKKDAQLQARSSVLQEFQDMLKTSEAQTVVLTGSTGTLGTYLLDSLLNNPSVAHVHCLNRRSDSRAIQHEKSSFYGLGSSLDSSRVSFWTADLSQPDLGLNADVFKTLQKTTTLVLHNAWAVNFNLSLSSFKPHLAGVVNLANFSSSGTQSPRLFFISSISSVMGHRTASAVTPEEVIQTQGPGPNSYADSKYLAEQLLDSAARERGLPASIARVGQIAGAARSPGLWNKSEWFPSLVLSSLHVGAIPDSLGPALDRIDWVPIDLLAEILVDLALQKPSSRGLVDVAHPLNLSPTTWEEIRPVVSDALSTFAGKPLDVVPFSEWISRTLLAQNPAAKLLDFFETSASTSEPGNVLDTQKTAQRSEKLRAVDAIKPEWIRKWVQEWL
ncbi:NRPS-like enzyme [Aspergillus steynii IBT 23096]|uniref:NRPS-like enzyme n=1 Tax=Aspergillus steynii IBT 23096 TaxID=1392250 RepID=A0A2I2FSR3_9EURO|nr:NRPS-like enzyme [Aspergillus steynii IBT 23096]PLB43654.1 NRPS-like enzyme [Aspergillus steynii IBT 23096]